MSVRRKIKVIFFILICLAVIKLGCLIFLLGNQISTLYAKEEKISYKCPPEITESLIAEKEKIEKEKKAILAKEKELKLLQKRIQEQIAVLKELEATIDSKLKDIQVAYGKRFQLLLKAFSEMRPAKAAALLMKMDKNTAIKILSQMKSSQVASILSSMPPEKAAEFSEALSGIPPKQY